MLFGLDGVEIGLIIVFACLFGGILSGFPVAFAIGGAGIISFGIIAALDSAGLMVHQAIDQSSQAYRDLVNSGVPNDAVSKFRYPDLPLIGESVFPQGWEVALDLVDHDGARLRPAARRFGGIDCGCGRVSCGLHRDRGRDCCHHGAAGAADHAAPRL